VRILSEKMYIVKLKDKELFYGGFMLFYDNEERAARYDFERANHIANLFRNEGVEIELVECLKFDFYRERGIGNGV
jgi:hypothetical protein